MRASPDSRTGILSISLPQEFYRSALRNQIVETGGFPAKLNSFQNQGNSLTHTDAHGAERIFAISTQALIERRGHQPRPASTEKATDANRATGWINARSGVRNFKLAHH